jgi:N,N'-diacetyllegionaminate synthase
MSAHDLSIGERLIGTGHPCLVIAEVAQGHDGSLGTAHAYIEAVAKSGADAIKFQTHIAAAESTPEEPFRIQFSPQDRTRYDYWKRMEFSEAQWQGLAEHAADRGLVFLSTPFSLDAVSLLDRIGVPAWKVGSGEVTNYPLIDRIARTKKPILFSTGMSSWDELDTATKWATINNAPIAVLQCTTAYPCPPERTGLNLLAEFRERYGCPVGISDHSGQIYAGLAAATLGANVIEVHVVFSRDCFGPDVAASVTITELKQLVDGVRFIEKAIANPVSKDAVASELTAVRSIFGKSLVAARDLAPGHLLVEADLALKKPGTGIPASRLSEILGRRVEREVMAGRLLSEGDLQ